MICLLGVRTWFCSLFTHVKVCDIWNSSCVPPYQTESRSHWRAQQAVATVSKLGIEVQKIWKSFKTLPEATEVQVFLCPSSACVRVRASIRVFVRLRQRQCIHLRQRLHFVSVSLTLCLRIHSLVHVWVSRRNCSVLQCVATCLSVLQRIHCCSVCSVVRKELQAFHAYAAHARSASHLLRCGAVAVRCERGACNKCVSYLRCIAACYSVL